MRCSRVHGSGTLEWFPVRHERVQLSCWAGGRKGGGQDSLPFASGRAPGCILQKAMPKGESALIRTPSELTFTYANTRQGLFHHHYWSRLA